MDGFATERSTLHAAAGVAREAGATMAGVDLAGDATHLGAALPGSDSAGASVGLAASWLRGVQGWAHQATSHGGNLDAAANTYGGDDGFSSGRVGSVFIPGLDDGPH